MLLQVFYGIRSERQLMERVEFDHLFRWFMGLGVDDPAWDHSSFTMNRDRLLGGEIAAKLATWGTPYGEPARPGSGWRHKPGDGHSRTGDGASADRPQARSKADHAWGRQGLRRTPHIAIDGHVHIRGKPRITAIDRRTTRHPGYNISQRCRKRIEEVFGWIKGSAGLARIKLRGRARVDAAFTLGLAAYNLIRLPKLLATPA